MSDKLFAAKSLAKLNSPRRLASLRPNWLWKLINSSCAKKLADIGAGSGYLTKEFLSFAPTAHIYALDTQPEMISYLKEHMPANITPQIISKGIFPLPTNSIDALWTITVYHEVEDRTLFLSEMKRVLKPQGKVLIVDWNKDKLACKQGPSYEHRVASAKVAQELAANGFQNIQTYDDLAWHYAIVAEA